VGGAVGGSGNGRLRNLARGTLEGESNTPTPLAKFMLLDIFSKKPLLKAELLVRGALAQRCEHPRVEIGLSWLPSSSHS
jgi:hypothetical protein